MELTRRVLLDCRLCGHKCGVNRFLKPGACGLRDRAYVAEVFTHVSEEVPVTPAGSVKLFQCALNCAGCQVWEVIHVSEAVMAKHSRILDETIWDECSDFDRAATIESVGGNPTESLFAILQALVGMSPALATKPIVWNCHPFETPIALTLLDGTVDSYIPDLKGCSACLQRFAGVAGYWERATTAIRAMLAQRARTIVPLLPLPGHRECCLRPAVEWLSGFRDRLWVSYIEYVPDHKALTDPTLNRRLTREEAHDARTLIRAAGLRDVVEDPEAFWT